MPRNGFLFQNAILMLPYTGAGSGIARVLDRCPDAKFENDDSRYEFIVTIPRKTNNDDAETNNDGAIIIDTTHKDAPRTNNEDPKTNKDKLTKKQLDIVNFCGVPRTAKEIMERLGITNQSNNRKLYILDLIELGFIEMTDPEHPKSKYQKYRRKR